MTLKNPPKSPKKALFCQLATL